MRAWQTAIMDADAIWQAEAAKEWEKQNAPDPFEKVLKQAAGDMVEAIGFLGVSIDRLVDASADLNGTPMQAKIDSFIDSLEEIKSELRMIRESWERGERE